MPGALALFVVFGLVALLLGSSRWLARRPWAALGNVAVGTALLATALVVWPASRHLRSYEPVPTQAVVAHIHCERAAPDTWRVTLTRLPRGRMEVYELAGDQWRLEARTLLWKEPAARLGLTPVYRFERLSARRLRTTPPAGADAEALRLPEGYPLAGSLDEDDDVWSRARAGGLWETAIEPGRLYGPWLPLREDARYEVRIAHAPGTADVRLEAQAIGYTRSRQGPTRATRN